MKKVTPYILEICCYNALDVINAFNAGAHRVELCAGYEVGGTTPSLGTLRMVKSLCEMPVFIMIRPRGGNFFYSDIEKKIMLQDIELALENKVDGIVFGALNADRSIDESFCKTVLKTCGSIPVTFHRAIDVCSNYETAIEFLAEIGVQCILTSGRGLKAIDAMDVIQNMHVSSKKSINIMAGSGVNEDNILSFAKIGLTYFHSSASIIKEFNVPSHDYQIPFNGQLKNNELSVVSKEKVKGMLHKLHDYFKKDISA